MDPILSTLSVRLHRFIEASLANDHVSSDAELRSHYLAQGLTEAQASQALRYRALYLQFIFFEGHTPILKGYEALTWVNGSLMAIRDYLRTLPESDQSVLRKDFAVLDDLHHNGTPARLPS